MFRKAAPYLPESIVLPIREVLLIGEWINFKLKMHSKLHYETLIFHYYNKLKVKKLNLNT